eukprot:3786649-Rhodomonas_salina.1
MGCPTRCCSVRTRRPLTPPWTRMMPRWPRTSREHCLHVSTRSPGPTAREHAPFVARGAYPTPPEEVPCHGDVSLETSMSPPDGVQGCLCHHQ